MHTPPAAPMGPWLAALIQAHLDDLATGLADAARQQIPLYRALDPAAVQTLFVALYQVLAQAYAANDVGLIRTYLEQVATIRMRDGASAAAFIQLVSISDAAVARLIQQAPRASPQYIGDALRHQQAMSNTIRLILSEINLRLLNPPPLREAAET
ncbi:MAG: hypothetical protein M3Z04_12650 [Chloroflexota bacterium]|nr:hypothetical protein [Chloroflexota bacterium]